MYLAFASSNYKSFWLSRYIVFLSIYTFFLKKSLAGLLPSKYKGDYVSIHSVVKLLYIKKP
jgi:hypothetical protein